MEHCQAIDDFERIQSELEIEKNKLLSSWQDCVADRFTEHFLDPYVCNLCELRGDLDELVGKTGENMEKLYQLQELAERIREERERQTYDY